MASKHLAALGRRIALARKRAGLTQRELAAKLDVTVMTISRWETGDMQPLTMVMVPLCDALGCSLDELMRGRGRKP